MLWIQSFHLFFIIAWFVGLFYLPRLYAYHAESKDIQTQTTFKTMEWRLFWIIMTPGAILTIALGLWLISLSPGAYMQAGWMHAKLSLVLLTVLFHAYLGLTLMRFRQDKNQNSPSFYKKVNEITSVLLLGILILATVKPF